MKLTATLLILLLMISPNLMAQEMRCRLHESAPNELLVCGTEVYAYKTLEDAREAVAASQAKDGRISLLTEQLQLSQEDVRLADQQIELYANKYNEAERRHELTMIHLEHYRKQAEKPFSLWRSPALHFAAGFILAAAVSVGFAVIYSEINYGNVYQR